MSDTTWTQIALYGAHRTPDTAQAFAQRDTREQLREYRETGAIQDWFLVNADGSSTDSPWEDGPKPEDIDWTGFVIDPIAPPMPKRGPFHTLGI